jgi:hypothetical protein
MKFCKTWLQKYMSLPPNLRNISLSYKEWKKKLKSQNPNEDILRDLRTQCDNIDRYISSTTNTRRTCFKCYGDEHAREHTPEHASPLYEFMALNRMCLYKICKRIDKTLPGTGAMKLLAEYRNRHFLNDYRSTFYKLESSRDNNEECPICLDMCNNFAILQCGHYFCMDCFLNIYGVKGKRGTLINILANTSRKLSCPLCRHVMEYNLFDSMHFWPKTYGRKLLTRLEH